MVQQHTIDGHASCRVPRRRRAWRSMMLVAVLIWPVASPAADYFVDFSGVAGSTCNDANPGTSRTSPWCTVPGTRKADDSGWLHAAWGLVTQSSARITAGDTIWIKAGTTHTAARGGRLLIGRCNAGSTVCPGGGEGFYANGTAANPIQIRSGAAHPTPWGSGVVTWDCAGMTIPSSANWNTDGCISVIDYDTPRANWLWIRGGGPASRVRVLNSAEYGIVAYTDAYGGSGTLVGFVLEQFEVDRAAQMGVHVVNADSTTIKDGVASNCGSSGVSFGLGAGGQPRKVRDGTIEDVESRGNGTNTASGNRNGFNCFDCGTAGQQAVVLRGDTHHNGRDGADNGLLSDGTTYILYLDTASHDNGEDGIACNGNDPCSTAPFCTVCSIVDSRLFNNTNDGTCAYETGTGQYVTNTILHNNGDVPALSSAGCHGASGTVSVSVQNSICYRPKASMRAFGSCGGQVGTVTRTVRNSIYIPRVADTDTFISPQSYDAAAPSGFTVFQGNKLGISSPNFDSPALFRAASDADFAANDYHPSSGAIAAVDAGAPYCRVTSPTGSGSTFAVDCDPRLYFFVSTNRPLVEPDTAYVGGTASCAITALSSSQVTCGGPVAWTQNDPVARHRVRGATIDIGAYEFGTLAAPSLLSVEPLP